MNKYVIKYRMYVDKVYKKDNTVRKMLCGTFDNVDDLETYALIFNIEKYDIEKVSEPMKDTSRKQNNRDKRTRKKNMNWRWLECKPYDKLS